MNFLQSMVSAVVSKQAEAMSNLESNTIDFLAPKEHRQYFEELPELVFQSITVKMEKHREVISTYLSKNVIKDYFSDLAVSEIEQRQNRFTENLGGNLEKALQSKLDIDTSSSLERPIRIEKETVYVAPSQNKKQSIKLSQKKVQRKVRQEQINSVSHSLPQNLDVKPVTVPSKFDRSAVLERKKENPEQYQMNASQFIQKRDIVKELEERRRKIQEQEHKSKKLKSKLVKLEPIATKKERELKEKEAKEKLLAGIEFVEGLHIRKQTIHIKPTEWRQQKLKSSEAKERHSPKYSFRKLSPLRLANKNFHDHEQYHVLDESSFKKTDRVVSKFQRGKNFVLKKPTPYNIYNVNFKEKVFQMHYK